MCSICNNEQEEAVLAPNEHDARVRHIDDDNDDEGASRVNSKLIPPAKHLLIGLIRLLILNDTNVNVAKVTFDINVQFTRIKCQLKNGWWNYTHIAQVETK